MPEEMKHPVILAKDFHISDLILNMFMKRWVMVVATICCPDYAKNIGFLVPLCQSGELCQFSPDEPPFVGVDYFGLFGVKRRISVLKRYAVRAIHIKLASSLDTDSFNNTIQPLLMGEKLRVMGVDDTMISWITDYLTGRPQFVRLGSVLSDVVVSDTGAPQGTVLSPFLFTLYTTDFQYNSDSCHLQKFSDDSAVVGCIRGGEEGEYRTLVDNFVEWSEQNHLRLNVNKTREMVIDFGRKKRMPSQPLRIRGEVVEDYKYLGVVIDNRLDWKSNTKAVYKKGMSRLFPEEAEIFQRVQQDSVVASAIFFAAVCWGSSIRASDTNRLDKIIKKADSVLGLRLESFESVVERRTLKKLLSIIDHSLGSVFILVECNQSSRKPLISL
ncbi:putative RNA-directed DNA polymerase from transposon X-element [Merluccius polli]|uniref:RNA-directed DNA polymerase from transposon X-element n=1 Tax=Merluccius polli TaxID=89951 RepID=A0AA47N4K7_MERPO|nr:putative RNA-directed DNA polymerase from transposon X-element [Merluccius polli]